MVLLLTPFCIYFSVFLCIRVGLTRFNNNLEFNTWLFDCCYSLLSGCCTWLWLHQHAWELEWSVTTHIWNPQCQFTFYTECPTLLVCPTLYLDQVAIWGVSDMEIWNQQALVKGHNVICPHNDYQALWPFIKQCILLPLSTHKWPLWVIFTGSYLPAYDDVHINLLNLQAYEGQWIEGPNMHILVLEGLVNHFFNKVVNSWAVINMHVLITAHELKALCWKLSTNFEIMLTHRFISKFTAVFDCADAIDGQLMESVHIRGLMQNLSFNL